MCGYAQGTGIGSKLDRHFEHAGFGVYVKHGVPVTQWELEGGTG